MSTPDRISPRSLWTIRVIGIVIFLYFASLVARTFAEVDDVQAMRLFLVLEAIFLLLLLLNVLWVRLPAWLQHLSTGIQCILVVTMICSYPSEDFIDALFVVLSYQVALIFSGSRRWFWTAVLILLTIGSLIFTSGVLKGLAYSLLNAAGEIIVVSFFVVLEEIERTRQKSESILTELQDTNRKLQAYISQVDELAAIEERNKLARELHDSVSQTMFSITLNTRAAQVVLSRNPDEVRPRLEHLQTLTQNCLAQMRSLITELRPKNES